MPPFKNSDPNPDYNPEEWFLKNTIDALSLVFRYWDIPMEIKAAKVLDPRLFNFSKHAHEVNVVGFALEVPAEYLFAFLRKVKNPKQLVFKKTGPKPNEGVIIAKFFVKIASSPIEAINEANGYSYVIEVDPKLAIVEHIYPPVGVGEVSELDPNGAREYFTMSFLNPGVRTLAQVQFLLTRDAILFTAFLKSLSRLHAEGVIHGDMLLQNVGYIEQSEDVTFGYMDYANVLCLNRFTEEEIELLPAAITDYLLKKQGQVQEHWNDQSILDFFSPLSQAVIYEAMVFNDEILYKPFRIDRNATGKEIYIRLHKILIVKDWHAMLAVSPEIKALVEDPQTSEREMKKLKTNLRKMIIQYCTDLAKRNPELDDSSIRYTLDYLVDSVFVMKKKPW